MASGMRTTSFLSLLLLVVASPARISSAQLPFPVTCLQRCADANLACVDACRRETEIETAEFPAEKRASAFVRIGRPSALTRRTSSLGSGSTLGMALRSALKSTLGVPARSYASGRKHRRSRRKATR